MSTGDGRRSQLANSFSFAKKQSKNTTSELLSKRSREDPEEKNNDINFESNVNSYNY